MADIERHPSAIPPAPAVMAILSRFDRQQLSGFIAVAIDLADAMDGEPEAEPGTWPEDVTARDYDAGLPEDSEPVGDEEDAAWIEWHTMRGSQKGGSNLAGQNEDDEEDDDAGQCTEDELSTILALRFGHGAGCTISDPGEDSDPGT